MHKVLVILAAGIGRRYGGLKQIEPVGPDGEAIVEYSVYDAVRWGFDRAVLVTRRAIEAEIEEAVGARLRKHIAVEYVHQELDTAAEGFAPPPSRTKPWGTGHAVLAARAVVDEPFGVVNADDFYGSASFALLAAHLDTCASTNPAAHALVGFPLAQTLSESGSVSRGVCRCAPDGRLIEITERTHIERADGGIRFVDRAGRSEPLDPAITVSMNMWGFHPSILGQLQELFAAFLTERGASADAEFHLPGAINALIRANRAGVRVLPTDARWCGITYAADKPRVQANIAEHIARGEYPSPLWS